MRERMNTEEFVARVAAPLKGDVPLSAGFDARVMRAVEEAARPWWQRTQVLTLSPLRGLAVAAGIAALMVIAGLGGSRLAGTSAPVVAATTDTVHVVRFVFSAPAARSVTIAGDFNGWSRTATPLSAVEVDGLWSVSIALPPGAHEYAFVVDGERWVADPLALTRRDEFGQESSVLHLSGDVLRGA